ncbi:MAG: SIS domain-containing protein [Bacteroidales bacterium]|nr:SIS domain-containing protein [Bacteroidales bacterium]
MSNPFLEEISGQSGALRATGKALEGFCLPPLEGGVILTGMGSSDFIASAGASLLRGRGVPAASFNAGELLHYAGPLKDNLTVCISQSGESYEIVHLLPSLGKVAAICNNPASTLAKRADYLLLTQAGKEEMTSTKTFVTSWQAMLSLCGAIAPGPEYDWEALAGSVEKALETDVSRAVVFIGDAPVLQMVARGPAMCAASQSALMWMEAAHIPAGAMCGGNFRHGPLEMVRPGMTVFIFTHSASATWPQSIRLAEDILAFGGKVLMLADTSPDIDSDRFLCLPVPCPSEELCPITTIVPVQLLVNAWAGSHGMSPGSFSHGAKVTVSE